MVGPVVPSKSFRFILLLYKLLENKLHASYIKIDIILRKKYCGHRCHFAKVLYHKAYALTEIIALHLLSKRLG
jgi:hypothetical protein